MIEPDDDEIEMSPVMPINTPKTTWLQLGDIGDIPEGTRFIDLDDVSWCDSQVGSNDIEYIRADLVDAQIAAAVAKERKRCEDICDEWISSFSIRNPISDTAKAIVAKIRSADNG